MGSVHCSKLEHLRWSPVHSGTLARLRLTERIENRRSLVNWNHNPQRALPQIPAPSRLGNLMHTCGVRFPPIRRHNLAQAQEKVWRLGGSSC